MAFAWTGVTGDPTTTAHVHLDLVPTTASYGNGCGTCVGVSGRVRLAIDTGDGFLAESMEGGLTVIPGDGARLDIVANSFEEFMGTLPDEPLEGRYDSAGIRIEQDLSGPKSPPHVIVYVPLGVNIAVLGESIDR